MGYADLGALKEHLALTDSDSDELLQRALDAASEWVDTYTRRTFGTPIEAVRTAVIGSDGVLRVDDLYEVTAITADTAGLRTFATTLDEDADYELRPFGGPPYSQVLAFPGGAVGFTPGLLVRIDGTWGYGSAPESVVEATLLLASRWFQRRNAPFGVLSAPEFGTFARVPAQDADVKALLSPYRLGGGLVFA
jgi:hypothetical protein